MYFKKSRRVLEIKKSEYRGKGEDAGQLNCTLDLCVVSRSRLMPRHGPLLKYWPIIPQEERQAEITGLRTLCVAFLIKLRTVRRVVVRQHLDRAIGCSGLLAREVENVGEL